MTRASKLARLVKPWATRRRTRSLLLSAFDPAIRGPVDAVVKKGEDLIGPGDEGVDDVVELRDLPGAIQVAEPVEGGEGKPSRSSAR